MASTTQTTPSRHNSIMQQFMNNRQEGSPSSSDEETTYMSVARSHSLVDDMDDDSPMPAKSPQKKRRIMSPHPSSGGWQDFCKKGTRFKALLDDAFVKVVSTTPSEEEESSETTNPASTNDSYTASVSSSSTVATLVRQKTAECILLQQELQKIKSEQAQLQALNNELREAARQQATRMQKMTNALQLASQNAAKARVDADSAEATAETLASQLQALQVVVDETKRASQVLLQEQNEIEQKAQLVEQKYVQTQADLARANTQRQKFQQRNLELALTSKTLEDRIQELKTRLDHQQGETKQWKQSCTELQAMEASQQQRMHRLEQELQQAQTLLVDATSTAAETESTATDLKNTLEKVQQANQQLHKHLEEQQAQTRKERESHQETLEAAQQETQWLKLQATSHQDQIQQLTLEKKAKEKRVSQMQLKVSNLERRLQESTNLVATTPTSDKGAFFTIPPLGGKENPLPTCKCSICFKDSVGLMQKCQCGKSGCTSRAHAICVNKIKPGPSVSHPGTPAPRLPVILCSSKSAAAITPIGTATNKW